MEISKGVLVALGRMVGDYRDMLCLSAASLSLEVMLSTVLTLLRKYQRCLPFPYQIYHLHAGCDGAASQDVSTLKHESKQLLPKAFHLRQTFGLNRCKSCQLPAAQVTGMDYGRLCFSLHGLMWATGTIKLFIALT